MCLRRSKRCSDTLYMVSVGPKHGSNNTEISDLVWFNLYLKVESREGEKSSGWKDKIIVFQKVVFCLSVAAMKSESEAQALQVQVNALHAVADVNSRASATDERC